MYIAASWRNVANDLKTHPHCEDEFVKKGLIGADALAGAETHWVTAHWKAQTPWEAKTHCEDALGGADALRRHIGWRRRIAKTHWIGIADRRRRIAKTHWGGEDGFSRHIARLRSR